jgi:hypothetical protein
MLIYNSALTFGYKDGFYFGKSWFTVGIWYLTPLSTIFKLYRGGQFY